MVREKVSFDRDFEDALERLRELQLQREAIAREEATVLTSILPENGDRASAPQEPAEPIAHRIPVVAAQPDGDFELGKHVHITNTLNHMRFRRPNFD